MEPEHREDQPASDRPATEPSVPNTDQDAFTAPFASEGLEGLRDSNC